MSKITRTVAALALAVSTFAAASPASALPSKKELAALKKRRKALRYDVKFKGSSIRAGGAKIIVNAPIRDVRQIITRFSKYSKIMPRFKKSRVVAKTKKTTDVYLEVPILHGAATVWAVSRFGKVRKVGKEYQLRGRMVKGNVKDLRAIWHLEKIDRRHTFVRLELLIVPKLPLPGKMVTGELAYASDKAVTATRDRAEARVKRRRTAKNRHRR